MEFIDTHTHTFDAAFDGCEDEVIGRALDAGVSVMLQADIDSHERGRMLTLTARHPGTLRHMLGLYPGSVREVPDFLSVSRASRAGPPSI